MQHSSALAWILWMQFANLHDDDDDEILCMFIQCCLDLDLDFVHYTIWHIICEYMAQSLRSGCSPQLPRAPISHSLHFKFLYLFRYFWLWFRVVFANRNCQFALNIIEWIKEIEREKLQRKKIALPHWKHFSDTFIYKVIYFHIN